VLILAALRLERRTKEMFGKKKLINTTQQSRAIKLHTF
jgi:hypothetical protein